MRKMACWLLSRCALQQRSAIARTVSAAARLGIALALSVLFSTVCVVMAQADGLPAAERQTTTPPKVRVVTDNPTTTSIQIRFWHGNDPVSGIAHFQVQRTQALPNATLPNPWPSNAITMSPNPVGEFDWTGLACGSHYYFRARGYGTGEAGGYIAEYGDWSDAVHGSTSSCTPPTPPQVTNVVTDRPTQTSILVRWDHPLPDTRFYRYKVRYRLSSDPIGWVEVTGEIAAGSKRVENLTCGSSYHFQVSGRGDGSENGFSTSYGPWSAEVQGSTSACTPSRLAAPVLDVIPLPERKALLTWGRDDRATGGYIVLRREFGGAWPALTSPDSIAVFNPANPGDNPSLEVILDDVLDNGNGLADAPYAYQFQVQAVHRRNAALNSAFSLPVTVIDTPITRADGNSPSGGQATLRYTSLETVLNDASYARGSYSFRYRRLGNSGGRHTSLNWKPDNPVNAGPPTSDNPITGLTLYEVYAIQLIYEKPGKERVYAARDMYVWPSDRAAGNGERVATFPLNHPLRNAQGAVNKTYAYHICTNTFEFTNRSDEWVELIVHAIGQWDLATDGLVTTTYLGTGCADYAGILKKIADGTPATIEQVRNIVKMFDVFGDITQPDIAKNEIILLDEKNPLFENTINDAAEFPELARHIGLAPCGFEARACAPRNPDPYAVLFTITPPYRLDLRTTDILLNYKSLKVPDPTPMDPNRTKHPPLTIPGGSSGMPAKPDRGDVKFNKCVDMERTVYATLVHESGHALGIRSGRDHDPRDVAYTTHHPTIAGSVMNYDTHPLVGFADYVAEQDCSPHPFDILAIFALYQSH